jgi:membrane fusion protein
VFRQQVLDARKTEWLGSISLAMPLPYRLLAAAAALAAVALAVLFVFGRYTRHEQAQGQLVPSLGLLAIAAPSSGVVTRALVAPNARVEKDQPLIELSTELDSPTLGKTRAAVAEELRAERARLEHDLESQQQLASRKADDARSRAAIARRELAQIDEQLRVQNKQVESASALLEKVQPLEARGYLSGLQKQQLESNALAARAELIALQRQRTDKEAQIASLANEQVQLPLSADVEHNEVLRKIQQVDAALAQNEAQRAIVLRAPQAGVVADAVVADGQSVAAGQRLLSIVPEGSSLQAEFWLRSRAVGFVRPGSRVALRYHAYPYQKFGLQYGAVADVSASAVSAAEVSAVLGRKSDEPLYRVVVELDRQSVAAYGKEQSLRPGMVLDGDILLDRRRLIDWVLEPVYGYGRTIRSPS